MTTKLAVSGGKLLNVCRYDNRLVAAMIAQREDYGDFLDTIVQADLRRNLAQIVVEMREALGLESDYAFKILKGDIS